jgi:hypothetical protein
VGTGLLVAGLVYRPVTDQAQLPNRIPEAAPYVVAEAQYYPPPFEEYWLDVGNPGQCQSCHKRIFDEWNGSMMSNAWRDPIWRAAFLFSARQTSTDGHCSVPAPPDGTARARHNPFAREGGCSSEFDIGTSRHALSRPGSLVDSFCARCHMPTNYVDNVPLHRVTYDASSGLEHGQVDPNFNPVSDNGTGIAFATLDEQRRNTQSGRSGVFCAVCHTMAETRDMPFHNLPRSVAPEGAEYVPALGRQSRASLLSSLERDIFNPPDPGRSNLGYAAGSGSFRLSPHAIAFPERLGPLAAHLPEWSGGDAYLSGVFKEPLRFERADTTKHHGFYHTLLTKSEMCSACHDVTNSLTIKNSAGKWVGGFPIERTYTEWAGSRYADRPGNDRFDRAFKRDCQTCHMQQDYGQPGTAQTLYDDEGNPRPLLRDQAATDGAVRPHFSHHFVGGNAYVTRMIGAGVDEMGHPQPYPDLSIFSFSSDDKKSPYANAFWTGIDKRGPLVQHARLAWDRLRNVLDLDLSGPRSARADTRAPLAITVTNSGSGHKFPTGFPEGRISWLAVHAFDLATGRELDIFDSSWNRTSRGVGNLTSEDVVDPNFPDCQWALPAGSPDPYAYQFKAVASLGDGCPTLDLVYAAALNLVTDGTGRPVDERGVVIDGSSPKGLPQFRDLDGDGDVYDDSFLSDTRLQPLPMDGSSLTLDRYSVVIPAGTVGPVAVTTAVYYQSAEAMVTKKFLGNLADTDTDFVLEPCVLGGPCDGRVPATEPAVVEGAPPVPMEVRSWIIQVAGANPPRTPARVIPYPAPGADGVFQDVVVKATFSEPVRGVDDRTFTLVDSHGNRVPAAVDQIGEGTWGLFPDRIFLEAGETYTARVAAGLCGVADDCTPRDVVWSFRTASSRDEGRGDTSVASGFPGPSPERLGPPPAVSSVRTDTGAVVVSFSEPTMNVNTTTLALRRTTADCGRRGPPVAGSVRSNPRGDVWTFVPAAPLDPGATYCVTVSAGVYDLQGQTLSVPFATTLSLAPKAGALKPTPSNKD